MLAIESNALNERIDLPLTMVVTDEGMAPEHFNFHSSDIIHTISVTALQLRGERAAWGDEIGVFTPDGLCVGASLWFNQLTRVEAFGDDPATDAVDGFRDGESFFFRVFDGSLSREFAGDYTLLAGDETLRSGGATRLSIEVPGLRRDNQWSLPLGWSLISANVHPDDPSLPGMLGALLADGSLMVLKNGIGHFFFPGRQFDNIERWNGTEGYWIKVKNPANFAASGDAISGDTPIELNAGWSLISYLPTFEMDATSAFAPLGDNLDVVKDGEGNFYLPAYGFSNIGNTRPGNGYAIRVQQATEFVYPGQGRNAATQESYQFTHADPPVSTGSCMSVLLIGEALRAGSEVVARSAEGVLVGAGIAQENGRLGLAVWGDDVLTTELDGLSSGEAFSLQIWNDVTGWESIALNLKTGSLVYSSDGITVGELMSTNLPTELVLSGAYPNPFNGLTTVKFSVPAASQVKLTLHDLLGKEVAGLLDGEVTAGSHAVVLTAGDLASGTYILKLRTANEYRTSKVVLIR